MNELLNILLVCIQGAYLCVRGDTTPPIKYYEPGTSCYIEGTFYESCPKLNYHEKPTRQR